MVLGKVSVSTPIRKKLEGDGSIVVKESVVRAVEGHFRYYGHGCF